MALKRGGFINNPDYRTFMDRLTRESELVANAYRNLFGLKYLEREAPPHQHYILKWDLIELLYRSLRSVLGEIQINPKNYTPKLNDRALRDSEVIYRILKKRYPYLENQESQIEIDGAPRDIIKGIKILSCDLVKKAISTKKINYPPCDRRTL